MAGLYDPQTQVPGQEQPDPGIMANLSAFMGNPGIQAALLSSGLHLMQPPSFGDTAASQIARAIGAGGESAQLQEKQRLASEEAASKQDLRGSQADLAGARAATAGAVSNAAADRLSHMRERDEGNRKLRELEAKIKISNMFNAVKAKIEKQNTDRQLLGQPPLPLPTLEEVAANPNLRALYGVDTSAPTAPPTPGQIGPSTGPTQQDLDYLKANPQAKDAFIRRFGASAVPQGM